MKVKEKLLSGMWVMLECNGNYQNERNVFIYRVQRCVQWLWGVSQEYEIKIENKKTKSKIKRQNRKIKKHKSKIKRLTCK